jgi:Flp pilus assembly protein TadB
MELNSFFLTLCGQKQTSCLTTAFFEILLVSLVVLSCLVNCSCHMPSRTTRKCKETSQQVKERLTREQANRTKKRISELLAYREEDSSSSSEEEQDNSPEVKCDSLSAVRRDLYLGLLCLLLLILLQAFWLRSVCLRFESFLL